MWTVWIAPNKERGYHYKKDAMIALQALITKGGVTCLLLNRQPRVNAQLWDGRV